MKHKQFLTASALTLALGSTVFLSTAASPAAPTPACGGDIPLSIARIYWEYNSTANDLGVHVKLDGEDWKRMKIFRPDESLLFDVKGLGPYQQLGMTELFFEGAEPNLADFPLSELLTRFPEGEYDFEGRTVDNEEIEGEADFSHTIPAGPRCAAQVGPGNLVRIVWAPVTTTPVGFPTRPVHIAGYQVIVHDFQVTVPANVHAVTLPPEFVQTLVPGTHPYEVLAIEENHNQTITEATFVR